MEWSVSPANSHKKLQELGRGGWLQSGAKKEFDPQWRVLQCCSISAAQRQSAERFLTPWRKVARQRLAPLAQGTIQQALAPWMIRPDRNQITRPKLPQVWFDLHTSQRYTQVDATKTDTYRFCSVGKACFGWQHKLFRMSSSILFKIS